MTLGTLRTQCLGHQFSSNQYSTYCDEAINEAQADLAQEIEFRALFDVETVTTVAGTITYTLPTDYMRSYSLEDTEENQELVFYPVGDYDLLDQDFSSGRPSVYTIDRGNIRLYPTPDAVYSLDFRHYRSPATLAADADIPEIPTRYHKLLRMYALARLFERENDLTQAQFHQERYNQEKSRAAADLQADTDDKQPSQVAGMWGDSGVLAPSSDLWPL